MTRKPRARQWVSARSPRRDCKWATAFGLSLASLCTPTHRRGRKRGRRPAKQRREDNTHGANNLHKVDCSRHPRLPLHLHGRLWAWHGGGGSPLPGTTRLTTDGRQPPPIRRRRGTGRCRLFPKRDDHKLGGRARRAAGGGGPTTIPNSIPTHTPTHTHTTSTLCAGRHGARGRRPNDA